MKIFYLQNISGATGPAIVDENVIPYLNCRISRFRPKMKILRALEIVLKLIGCQYAIMSSMSRFNKLVIKACKILKIKTVYFMHGCAKQESEINAIPYGLKDIEEYTIAKCDKIICVSQKFASYIVDNMNVAPAKISVVNNGLEMGRNFSKDQPRKLSIITTGGSVPGKNNIKVCQAIETIANKYPELDFTVIHSGTNEDGRKKFESYPFVKYLDTMPQEELFKLMAISRIYIQNSTYETFGLAVAESINQGCDVLLAKNIGIIDLINMPKEYIIQDNNDIIEIASKIEYIIENPNNDLLNANINKGTMSWEACANNIMNVVKSF